MSEQGQGKFWAVYQDLKAGRISRREFLAKATALGVAAPVAAFVVNSLGTGGAAAAPAGGSKGLRSGTQAAATRPSSGTEGQQRGAGGELKMLQWQAATHISLHNSTGTKDTLAASLVTEPLMNYLPDGSLVANLVSEIPTVENGGLSADLKTVTYKLLPGVLWSDGQPFTADDVVFTWEWIVNPENQSVNQTNYEPIESVVALDPHDGPDHLQAAESGLVLPVHRHRHRQCLPQALLGWQGPPNGQRRVPQGADRHRTVTSSSPSPRTTRSPTRQRELPRAKQAVLRPRQPQGRRRRGLGGPGRPPDRRLGLRLEPPGRAEHPQGDGERPARARSSPAGTSVERVLVNFSDPERRVDGRALAHRRAAPVPDRQGGSPGAVARLRPADDVRSVLPGRPVGTAGAQHPDRHRRFGSPNTTWEFNLDKAKQTLEAAGWTGDGVRSKDGVELKVKYFTSINAVRQKTQAVNKNNWEEIGFEVTLGQVDAGVFFDSAAGNDQNASHFFRDLQMYTNDPSSTFPLTYMQSWYAGPEKVNIAQKSNGWSGSQRHPLRQRRVRRPLRIAGVGDSTPRPRPRPSSR